MNKRDLKDGMIVRTRGIKDEYYEFYILNSKFYSKASVIEESSLEMSDFNDDLTHKEYKNYDIMKVFYDNKEIWERPLDWAKVAFGTEVVAYDGLIANRVVGKLLKYDNRAECYKFFVYYEDEYGVCQTGFFKECALLKDIEPEEESNVDPSYMENYIPTGKLVAPDMNIPSNNDDIDDIFDDLRNVTRNLVSKCQELKEENEQLKMLLNNAREREKKWMTQATLYRQQLISNK